MAFTSFTISQAFLGAPLQFYPVLGSLELEELIGAFVTGSSSKSEKMSEVTLDFFNNATVDLNTGALVRHYNVFSTAAATWSPTQSNSSGFSPAIYTPSPASSTAATSFGDSGYGSFSAAAQTPPAVKNTNSVVAGRVSKKVKKTNDTRLPGFSIMTKDGVDVTNSAGRGTKTKEQREHAHLMRIMKACEACKKKKVRVSYPPFLCKQEKANWLSKQCDPSHRRAQTDMSRSSTTSSSSASAAKTHTSSSSSSGTSSSLPSPPTNNSSIPAFTNALDDFVLFPQEVSSWNPYSFSDTNIPNDFHLSDFDFDSFDVTGGSIDFNEFSPLNPDTSFFHQEAQFQAPHHSGVEFSIPNYAQSQQPHGQEDALNDDGANWDLPLQTSRSQRPAISPSDASQVPLQQQARLRSQSQTQQVRSRTQAPTCPLHELGEDLRQQRGATSSSRGTQLESFPLERFLQSPSAPLVSEDFSSLWNIATNSLLSQSSPQPSQASQMDDGSTTHSPMDWSLLDVSTNATSSSGRLPTDSPLLVENASHAQQVSRSHLHQQQERSSDPQHAQSSNAQVQDSSSYNPIDMASSPLSTGDVIHDLSQRPQQASKQSLGGERLQTSETLSSAVQSLCLAVQSPWSTSSSTSLSLFWLALGLSMIMVSSPFLSDSLRSLREYMDASSWGYPRLALSALFLSQLSFPSSTTDLFRLEGLSQSLQALSTLILVLGGSFLSSSSGSFASGRSRSTPNASSGYFETGLFASGIPKARTPVSKSRASNLFGVDIGMGSGRGIVTPWVLSLLREFSDDFALAGEDGNEDVVMMD